MNGQRFGTGDVAILHERSGREIRVKVLECCEDNGKWYYEVTAVEFDAPFPREVPDEMLTEI